MYLLGVYTAQNKVKVLDEKHKQVSDKTWTPHEAAKILLEWERDRADLIACIRELVAQIEAFDPDGCKPEQVYGGRVAYARSLLARLEKGERPCPA